NSGDWNSGSRNSGDWNSGDWNSCNFETGFFNNKTPNKISVFGKPCLRSEWKEAVKPNFISFDLTEWVEYSEEEKNQDKNKELIEGYLKKFEYKEAFINSFNKATKEDVELLLKLPNFNYKIFEDISGISRKMIEEKLK
ncbi:MAG: pentapeptide repeat-containing protein, partial [Candidatus Nanoarchaeia archaeon]